jgi:D-amino-acid oxidase|nr:FAD-dependent oxidoreductase [Kofleriaceae bacterium]
MSDVTVVGAGVIGLTCALILEERGHRVRVVAAATSPHTTSDVAGAVWFPYRAGPRDAVTRWAARTRAWLDELAAIEPAAGVDVLDAYELADDLAVEPWWAAAAPVARGAWRGLAAWRFRAPRAEPALHLAWLASQLHAPFEARAVRDLASERGDVVVNCTGLAARALCGDRELAPLFGQVAIVAADSGSDLGVTVADDRDPAATFYAIPRRDSIVLGGCAIAGRDDLAPDPAITTRVVARARELGIAFGDVRAVRTGLRPARPEIRLEADGRVIHCYGHGGAGFTLARGCADDVAALVDRAGAR